MGLYEGGNMILNYIKNGPEYDGKLANAVYQDADYQEAEKQFKDCIETLNEKSGNEIDDNAASMMAAAMDAAFDHGFSEGVRFIMGCVAG